MSLDTLPDTIICAILCKLPLPGLVAATAINKRFQAAVKTSLASFRSLQFRISGCCRCKFSPSTASADLCATRSYWLDGSHVKHPRLLLDNPELLKCIESLSLASGAICWYENIEDVQLFEELMAHLTAVKSLQLAFCDKRNFDRDPDPDEDEQTLGANIRMMRPSEAFLKACLRLCPNLDTFQLDHSGGGLFGSGLSDPDHEALATAVKAMGSLMKTTIPSTVFLKLVKPKSSFKRMSLAPKSSCDGTEPKAGSEPENPGSEPSSPRRPPPPPVIDQQIMDLLSKLNELQLLADKVGRSMYGEIIDLVSHTCLNLEVFAFHSFEHPTKARLGAAPKLLSLEKLSKLSKLELLLGPEFDEQSVTNMLQELPSVTDVTLFFAQDVSVLQLCPNASSMTLILDRHSDYSAIYRTVKTIIESSKGKLQKLRIDSPRDCSHSELALYLANVVDLSTRSSPCLKQLIVGGISLDEFLDAENEDEESSPSSSGANRYFSFVPSFAVKVFSFIGSSLAGAFLSKDEMILQAIFQMKTLELVEVDFKWFGQYHVLQQLAVAMEAGSLKRLRLRLLWHDQLHRDMYPIKKEYVTPVLTLLYHNRNKTSRPPNVKFFSLLVC